MEVVAVLPVVVDLDLTLDEEVVGVPPGDEALRLCLCGEQLHTRDQNHGGKNGGSMWMRRKKL